jgi:shikimate dehydrogenase
MICGLLGQHLGHSYSPAIHSQLANYSYSLYEKEPQDLAEFLKNGDFQGLNVTIPYKKAVIPYLDELSPVATRLGAVNTIVRRSDGTLIGHNTDYFGFRSMVEQSGLRPQCKKALVLGSGGASNTAVAVLEEIGAQVVVISRSGENNYANLDRHSDAAIIVNTTPVGMYPHVGTAPIDLTLFPQLEGVLDVIYNPARTQLLLDAEARGLITMNGLWMLVAQAKESAEWFSGHSVSNDRIRQIHHRLQQQMENIILIGMPGCGKSTVGRKLASRLGRKFVDADAAIEAHAGMTIPAIFAQQGEEGFRKIETTVLAQLGKESGLVLATGGGCVTRPENYPPLHQNGRIIWIRRDLSQLPTKGRPLSQDGKLAAMYQIRKPMYQRFADLTVENSSDPDCTVQKILNLLEVER